ncbi:PilZ domain-containing protein [Sphingomonas sp.]|uniref:PilZ domain-containing protein n=1 Tax=Sphingomonas sp. TaxID=28214 RepID=UPI001B281A35|nr:PilZ domain-containing protein [Sphingomonas sp.]MBO9711373.1 PilZ domain-containing protein [Sphingomonas sp.]
MATRLTAYRTVAPASIELRGAPRRLVLLKSATVQRRGGRATSAQLHDVSVYGCRLICRARHDEGTNLWLSFEGEVAVPATVVWNDGEQIGCRFAEPISRELMRELTRLPS